MTLPSMFFLTGVESDIRYFWSGGTHQGGSFVEREEEGSETGRHANIVVMVGKHCSCYSMKGVKEEGREPFTNDISEEGCKVLFKADS